MNKVAKKRMHRTIVLVLVLLLVGITLYKHGAFSGGSQNANSTEGYANDYEYKHIGATKFDDSADVSRAVAILVAQSDADFRQGLPLNDSFFYWLSDSYGKAALCDIAYKVSEYGSDPELWEEYTGSTVQALYYEFCNSKNYSTATTENVHSTEGDGTISVVGDINLADDWYTMQSLQGKDFSSAIDPELTSLLNASSLTCVNNEFAYTSGGSPLEGKAYTFGSNPSHIADLLSLGTDIVSLGNNHVYDYGEAGLMETIQTLDDNGVAYVGAGVNLADAMTPQYYIVDGKKVAVVAATQIEINLRYTREATDISPGVLKTQDPNRFVSVISEAKANSDYVIVYVHWGWEGKLRPDQDQLDMAQTYVDAGADLIIGNHSHRLQGATYIDDVPVIYSLGNFWMSTGSLYTTVVQVNFDENDQAQVRLLPVLQSDLKTTLITDESAAFYKYVADLSDHVAYSEDGYMHQPMTSDDAVYFSEMNYAYRSGNYDVNGEIIDNVGNLE